MMQINKTYFKIFLVLSVLYLAFQTKTWTNVSGNIYVGDDNSYYGYVSTIVNDFDFDLSNNQVIGHAGISSKTGRVTVVHPIGTSMRFDLDESMVRFFDPQTESALPVPDSIGIGTERRLAEDISG